MSFCLLKVQRPVYDSMLDLDLTLDCLNSNHLYAIKLSPNMTEYLRISAKVNEHTWDAKELVGKVSATGLPLATTESKLCEDTVRETFTRFGQVEQVILLATHGKHTRHTHISELEVVSFLLDRLLFVWELMQDCMCLWWTEFQSLKDKDTALSCAGDLWRENYLVCPSLTPSHLPSWLALTAPTDGNPGENEEMSHMNTSTQVCILLKLILLLIHLL